MPEHLRALIVLVWLAGAALAICLSLGSGSAGAPVRSLARQLFGLWLAVNLAAFLAGNVWLFAGLYTLVLILVANRDGLRLEAYLFLLFALPNFSFDIPGFGFINYFMALSPLRLLSLVLLVPLALEVSRHPAAPPFGHCLADRILAAYLIYTTAITFFGFDTFTGALRQAVCNTLDIFLVYFVASRSLVNEHMLRRVGIVFTMAGVLLALIALFEFTKRWTLYTSLYDALGNVSKASGYLFRNDLLRARATGIQPIALGLEFVVILACGFYARHLLPAAVLRRGVPVLLVGGLVASLSRGPWLGALAALVIFVAARPRPSEGFARLALLGVFCTGLLLIVPFGKQLIDMLPFIGSVDAGNVTYRQRLWDVSLQVIGKNPWFGSVDFMTDPDMLDLKNGRGLIDIVNTYLQIALEYGLVGAGLFIGFFAAVLATLLRAMVSARVAGEQELAVFAAALLAGLGGVLLTIATVSSIGVIAPLYWLLAGFGVGVSHLIEERVFPPADAGVLAAAHSRGA